jgi:hypothetical protein
VLQRSSRSNIDGRCCDEQAEEEKAQPRHPERNKSISLVTRLALEASRRAAAAHNSLSGAIANHIRRQKAAVPLYRSTPVVELKKT